MFRTIPVLILLLLVTQAKADDFFLTEEGSVADLTSGLVWQGTSRTAESYSAAKADCWSSGTNGYRWRLPSVDEFRNVQDQLTHTLLRPIGLRVTRNF